MIFFILMQWGNVVMRGIIATVNICDACMANIPIEDCIRENVKVIKEFVDDERAKVEIGNKELLDICQSFCRRVILFSMGKIPFLWRGN